MRANTHQLLNRFSSATTNMKCIILTALFVVAAATYGKDGTGFASPVYSTTASENTYFSSASVATSSTSVATSSASASVATSSSVSDSSYSSPSFSVYPAEATSGSVYSEVSQSDAVHVNTSGEDDEDDEDDDDDEADTESHAESESVTQEYPNYATTSLASLSNGKLDYTIDSNVAGIYSDPAYQAPGAVTFNKGLSVTVPSVYETPVTASSIYEENVAIPPHFLPYWLRPSATKSY